MRPDGEGIGTEIRAQALAASSVGTWEWRIEDDVLRCDPAAASLFGLPLERAAHGAPSGFFVDRLHPQDRERIGALLADLRRRGGLYVAQYRTVPEPGRVRWVLARGRFAADADGVVRAAHGIVVDVTESREDGYVEGDAFLVPDAGTGETVLDRVAEHALMMRRVAEGLAPAAFARLKPLMETTLREIGRQLARQQSGPPDRMH